MIKSRLKPGWAWPVAVGAVVALSSGCRSTIERPLDSDGRGVNAGDTRLDHGYGTLLDLLRDEARVEQILIIKSPAAGLADLLQRISAQAKNDARRLERLFADDPMVDTSRTGLGVIETDVRSRIAEQEATALIFAGGRSFELRILLTQDKAASYAAALASSLSKADPQSSRRNVLEAMSREWQELGDEIRGWLEVRTVPDQRPAPPVSGVDRTSAST